MSENIRVAKIGAFQGIAIAVVSAAATLFATYMSKKGDEKTPDASYKSLTYEVVYSESETSGCSEQVANGKRNYFITFKKDVDATDLFTTLASCAQRYCISEGYANAGIKNLDCGEVSCTASGCRPASCITDLICAKKVL